MKFEIGFEKNGVCQARIIDGPSAEICAAYLAEIDPRATIYGAGPADGVKPGQPCTTVPADWTPASVAAPAEAPDRRQQIRDDYAGIVAQYLNAGSDYNGARLFAMRDTAAQWDLDPATFPGYAELVSRCYPDPDAPAEAPENPVPLDPEKARPRQRVFRVVDGVGHVHDFCTAAAALRLAATAGNNARFLQRASNRRGTWLPMTHTSLQAAAAAEAARAATAAATKNVSTVAAPVPDPDAPAQAHFSDGNMKLGKIANFSLAPMTTCSRQACETCGKGGCYALKSYHAYPTTHAAWDDNTELALYSPDCLETIIRVYLSKKRRKPIRFFRLHVGGDFVTRDYLNMWCRVAADFPAIHFLAFTKQFNVLRDCLENIPANLTIRLSDWPGTTVPADLRQRFHVAWMNDDTRPADTFPADALECPGNCETCGACWNIDRDTIFHKH